MAKQGLLFQIRHARTVENISVMRQIGGFLARGLIIVVALLGISYFAVNRYLSSPTYGGKLQEEVKEALGLESIEAKGFTRRQGSGGYRNLEMEGGKDTFFYQAQLKDLSGPFDFLTGIAAGWNPEELRIAEAEIELKAGGDEEEMKSAFELILKTLKGEGVKRVVIDKFNGDWGYSKLTYGRIEGTNFQADLNNGEWVIKLTSGTFQQNWLEGYQLVKATLMVSEQGITVKSLDLKDGSGSLKLQGEITGPPGKPELNLSGKFEHLPLEKTFKLQGVSNRDYFSGLISGTMQISGSTDRMVQIEGKVALEKDDVVTLREKWAILKAVSLIDVDRSYRRLDFTEGGFSFKTANGSLEVSDLMLKAADTAILKGNLVTRLPDQKEAAEALEITLTEGFSDGNTFVDDFTDSSAGKRMEDARWSLTRAAEGGKRTSEYEFFADTIKKTSLETSSENSREMNERRLMQEMNVHRVKGDLRLGVPASAFNAYEKLLALYPADEDGWRWVDIEIDSTFTKISQSAHDRLIRESSTRDLIFETPE